MDEQDAERIAKLTDLVRMRDNEIYRLTEQVKKLVGALSVVTALNQKLEKEKEHEDSGK